MEWVGWLTLYALVTPMLACVSVLTWEVTKCYLGETAIKRAQRRKEEGRK